MEQLFGDFSPLLVMVLIAGLVEAIKRTGLSGNKLMFASMCIGTMFGVLYQLGEIFPAVVPWLRVFVYGGLVGLATSGLYDLGKRYTLPKQ